MKRSVLKVKFVDFWEDLNKPEGNFLFDALSEDYIVEFSDDPQVVFYSCFGKEHLFYSCTKIFFSGENRRPNFSRADYAITFDYLNDTRHLRWPLWVYYFTEKPEYQISKPIHTAYDNWLAKEKFCCIMISNSVPQERIEFYNILNKRMHVDSAGRWNNTIGKIFEWGTKHKLAFINDYRFVISFENSAHPGYTTEKLLESLIIGSIPIYWGDPLVNKDFNPKRFINVSDFASYEQAADWIMSLEKNKELAKSILSEPIFNDDKKPIYLDKNYLKDQLIKWIDEAAKNQFKGKAILYIRLMQILRLFKRWLINPVIKNFLKKKTDK